PTVSSPAPAALSAATASIAGRLVRPVNSVKMCALRPVIRLMGATVNSRISGMERAVESRLIAIPEGRGGRRFGLGDRVAFNWTARVSGVVQLNGTGRVSGVVQFNGTTGSCGVVSLSWTTG